MKGIAQLIIFGAILFFVLKAATFGWIFWQGSDRRYPAHSDFTLPARLQNHVCRLSQDIGERSIFRYEALVKTRQYIADSFRSLGYAVEFQEYKLYDKLVSNIIATKAGAEKSGRTIILGAHYDSCLNPGADDNASGVAGILELARLMRDIKTRHTLKFVAFVNEEPPFFKTEDMGSRVYVRGAKVKGEDIRAVIILEMIGYYSQRPCSQRYPLFFGIGYPNKGNFITVVGDFASRRLASAVAGSFKKYSAFPVQIFLGPRFISGVDFSDHWSFWQEGFPAVMVTDTAFYRNKNYHKHSDTADTLDYLSMAAVVEGLQGAVLGLDEQGGV